MREPGRLILRLTRALGMIRLRNTVLMPAIADMQHECGEVESSWRRTLVLARGYWSLLSGAVFYAALLPARHLRENWSSRDAAGPRLLRQAWPAAAAVALLCFTWVQGMTTFSPDPDWRVPAGMAPMMVAGFVLTVAPLALAIGVGWALARDRSSSRAAPAIGLTAAAMLFALFDLALPRAVQSYRVASGMERPGLSDVRSKVGPEMTFLELQQAITLAENGACPSPRPRATCGMRVNLPALRLERQQRMSIPALGFSFVLLAVGLARSGRRALVVPGVWLAYAAAIWLTKLGASGDASRDLPIAVATWSAHLVPLTLAAILRFTIRDRTPTAA